MARLRDQFPLSDHRACLAGYLRGVVFPGVSVAKQIIEECPARATPLRPALVLWGCGAGGGDLADALPVAAAFDLFERFLLLHAELTGESAPAVTRWGLGQSLNAGDALYALAFRSLAGDVAHPARRLRTANLVGRAVLAAIESGGDAERNAALTGAALQAGAVIAGAPEPVVEAFLRAGRLVGTAMTVASAAAARRASREAIAALEPSTSAADLALFEEVARYVARRAA